jgi:hypothetical protein
LHVYSWPNGELKQTLDLGSTGLLPLEVISLDQYVDSYDLDMANVSLLMMHAQTHFCLYTVIIAARHRDSSNKISDISLFD